VNWGPALYLVVGVALALLGTALNRGWRLARRTAIIGAAMLIATSLLPVSAAFTYFQIVPLILHGIKLVLAIMAIQYLLRPEVVEFFNARVGPRPTE
jgi:sulfite exporter TauE/SafE